VKLLGSVVNVTPATLLGKSLGLTGEKTAGSTLWITSDHHHCVKISGARQKVKGNFHKTHP
jgi:hypothetical protein